MEVYRYQAKGKIKGPKDRLYIHNQGVLVCSIGVGRDIDLSNRAASFSDSSDEIRHAEDFVKGYSKDMYIDFGKVELPDEKVKELIASHKAKERAERGFQEKTASLTSLIS